jgi:hypothetical protein
MVGAARSLGRQLSIGAAGEGHGGRKTRRSGGGGGVGGRWRRRTRSRRFVCFLHVLPSPPHWLTRLVALTHSLTHSLPHSLTHPPTHPPTRTYSLARFLTARAVCAIMQIQELQKELASCYASITQAQSELLSTKASLSVVCACVLANVADGGEGSAAAAAAAAAAASVNNPPTHSKFLPPPLRFLSLSIFFKLLLPSPRPCCLCCRPLPLSVL